MANHPIASRATGLGISLAVILSSAALLALPAQAEVNPVESDCGDVAFGAICYEYQVIRTENNVRLGPETIIIDIAPVGANTPAGDKITTETTAKYSVTNALSQTHAFTWAFGGEAEGSGKFGKPGSVDLGASIKGTAGITGSRTEVTTDTTQSDVTVRTVLDLVIPALKAKQGYRIYTQAIGSRYEVAQRECVRKVWGSDCGEWGANPMIVEVPEGLGVRILNLGWSQTVFRSCRTPDTVWTSHRYPERIGELAGVGCMTLDFTTNKYQLTNGAGQVLLMGEFQTGSVQENQVTLDPDTIQVTLEPGRQSATGTITITREPWSEGNTFRPHVMDSDEITWMAGTPAYRTGFNMPSWPRG